VPSYCSHFFRKANQNTTFKSTNISVSVLPFESGKTHRGMFFSVVLGDTFDILALINNSINFLLYCLMSRAFRDTFRQTFCVCEGADQHSSQSSSAQAAATKQLHLDASTSYNTLLTQKCSEGYRASLSPIIKSLSDNPAKNKKHKGFGYLKQSSSVVL
jgi:hypothetical protein